MEDILVPIFVCVVLPVAIVLIRHLSTINSENKRSQVLIKAIEANSNIDTNKLAESLQQPKKQKRTPLELLNLRLLRGCIFTILGVSLLIVILVNYLCEGCVIDAGLVKTMCIFGVPSLAVGIGYLIVYFVSRKQVWQHKGE